MAQRRTQRVAHLIQQVIGEMLLHDMGDSRLNRIVITGCKVTPDLQIAHVYYSVLADQEREDVRHEMEHALHSATGFIRRRLGRSIRMRHVPQILFHFDETLQSARRLDQILATLKPTSQEPSEVASIQSDDEPSRAPHED